jgi:hypothetical protein
MGAVKRYIFLAHSRRFGRMCFAENAKKTTIIYFYIQKAGKQQGFKRRR